MKRRIFTFLLAAALVLLTACSSRGVVRPPVRIGEGTGNACFNRSFSLTEAFEEADADYPDAYQSVGSFSTVLYAADAVDGTRYYLDRFGLMSMREQETGDSALGQPLSRMQESTVEELRADLEKTDPCWRRVFPPGSGRIVPLKPMSIPRTPWRPCSHR